MLHPSQANLNEKQLQSIISECIGWSHGNAKCSLNLKPGAALVLEREKLLLANPPDPNAVRPPRDNDDDEG